MGDNGQMSSGEFSIGDVGGVLSALVAHSGDCVAIIDLDGIVRQWNPACESALGWPAEKTVGAYLPHIPDNVRLRFVNDLRAVAASGAPARRQLDSVRSDGSAIATDAVMIPLVDGDGDPSGVLLLIGGISSDQRLDAQRVAFASMVGRRLLDPLVDVASAAQLLARPEVAVDDSRRSQLSGAVVERSHEAISMVQDLLLMADLDEGTVDLRREPCDPGALVTRVVSGMGPRAERVVVDFDPAVGSAQLDPMRVSQAVDTLLDASLRVCPQDTDVEVSVYRDGEDIAIEVRDQGPEVLPSEREAIFDRFYNGPDERGRLDGGIPLHIVKGVADLHGGTVRAESASSGTRFLMRLPALAH